VTSLDVVSQRVSKILHYYRISSDLECHEWTKEFDLLADVITKLQMIGTALELKENTSERVPT
jgi:hypothetical protein